MLAAKIFDNDDELKTSKCLSIVDRHSLGIEIALYGGRPLSKDTLSFVDSLPSEKKRLHLNHHSYCASSMLSSKDSGPGSLFWSELSFCAELSIPAAILHPFKNGFGIHPDSGVSIEDAVSFAVESAENFHAKTGGSVSLLFENLMEKEPSFPAMLRLMEKLGSRLFGLCLDIGHAKVWGGRCLSEWEGFCSKAHAMGAPLHFHLHTTDSLGDLHMSFGESQDIGHNSHPFFGPGGAPAAISRLLSLFPNAVHCLETGPAALPGNVDWLIANGFLQSTLPGVAKTSE